MTNIELQNLLKGMSIEEKIGQLVQLNGKFFDTDEEVSTGPKSKLQLSRDAISKTGSLLNTFGSETLKQIQKTYLENSESKIPLLFMADILNGFKTVFPISLALGCSFDFEMVKRTARIAAHEASACGMHVTFSPMVDLVQDARWGRVMESYGEDPYLNAQCSKAMVEGYQNDPDPSKRILACVKHFAGYGAVMAGREYNRVELGERTLREYYLPSYKAAIDAGCHMVMTSFSTVDGIPATANEWLLKDILRDEWGFDGAVISDHSAIKELIDHGVAKNEKDAAKQAMQAGCDIDMMTACYANHLKELVEEGSLCETQIDEACMRVLKIKNELGLFENPYRSVDEEAKKEIILCDEHRSFAREVVTKSCVLLKNENHTLPLAKDKKIALIGPYAEYGGIFGMWSIVTDQESVVSLKEGFANMIGQENIQICKGAAIMDQGSIACFGGVTLQVGSDNPEGELQEAIEIAQKQDVIILALGEHAQQSGEGGARGELTLAKTQMRLLKEMHKLGKPIVVLLFGGRPLDLREVEEYCDALLVCWFPGVEGGNGIADLIYGNANPSGRLAMSFPYSVGQYPMAYNELSTGRPVLPTTESKRFISRYMDIPNQPLHCFGFGLSYSTFVYKNVRMDRNTLHEFDNIHISVDITNTSDIAGWETAQLYIRDLVGSVARPVKELKGVQKVHLLPNETKTVEFVIQEDMLRFYTRSMKYESEAGEFKVYIGCNCEDVLEASFTLEK